MGEHLSIVFKDDRRYTNIHGSPGPSPLEFSWDVVDAVDQKLGGKIEIGKGAVKRYNEKHQPHDGMYVDGEAVAFEIWTETMVKEFFEELSDVFRAASSFLLFGYSWCGSERSWTVARKASKQAVVETRRAERNLWMSTCHTR